MEFSHRFSVRSFIANITSRRVHRDFVSMLRAESFKDCLPDRDRNDLQCVVNVSHSFRNETYKFMNFRKSETRIDQNGKVFAKITCFFGAVKPPRSGPSETALRLRSLPEGDPPQAKFFFIVDQNV